MAKINFNQKMKFFYQLLFFTFWLCFPRWLHTQTQTHFSRTTPSLNTGCTLCSRGWVYSSLSHHFHSPPLQCWPSSLQWPASLCICIIKMPSRKRNLTNGLPTARKLGIPEKYYCRVHLLCMSCSWERSMKNSCLHATKLPRRYFRCH